MRNPGAVALVAGTMNACARFYVWLREAGEAEHRQEDGRRRDTEQQPAEGSEQQREEVT